MKIVEDDSQCYGCGACAQECERNAIIMKEDAEGFLYPHIDAERCINCGKCIETCQSHKKNSDNKQKESVALAVRNKDWIVRSESSSGGVFFPLAKWIIDMGGVVFGAAFDVDFNVIHVGVKREKNLKSLMGSKYVQSDIKNTYREAKGYLREGKWVLFSGTPCQIIGLKTYLDGNCDTEKLICVSIICHGTCSPMVWRRYLNLKKGQYSKDQIKQISFRDKKQGWRQFGLHISFEDVDYEQSHSEDLYMKGFLQNLYLRPSCYACHAKKYIEDSDVIIGDFWGIENSVPQLDDNQGVSCVLLNSSKGKMIWNKIKDEFIMAEISVKQVERENTALKSSATMNPQRALFFEELKETGLVEESIKDNLINNVIPVSDRQIVQYPIVYKYLSNAIRGITLKGFLSDLGWKRIALYAYTDLMRVVCEDIVRAGGDLTVTCIGDKGYKKYANLYNGVRIVGADYLVDSISSGETDGVVVCNPLRENVIMDELMMKGISSEKLISITSAIFN